MIELYLYLSIFMYLILLIIVVFLTVKIHFWTKLIKQNTKKIGIEKDNIEIFLKKTRVLVLNTLKYTKQAKQFKPDNIVSNLISVLNIIVWINNFLSIKSVKKCK